jgi:hypothetical protein
MNLTTLHKVYTESAWVRRPQEQPPPKLKTLIQVNSKVGFGLKSPKRNVIELQENQKKIKMEFIEQNKEYLQSLNSQKDNESYYAKPYWPVR